MSRLAKLFIRTPASRRFHSRSTIVLVAALRCAGLTDRRLRRSLAGYSVQPRASRRGWILTPVAGCWNARRVTLSLLAHNYTRLPRRGLRIVPFVDTLYVSFAPRRCPQTEGAKTSSQILFIVRKSSTITLSFKVWICEHTKYYNFSDEQKRYVCHKNNVRPGIEISDGFSARFFSMGSS